MCKLSFSGDIMYVLCWLNQITLISKDLLGAYNMFNTDVGRGNTVLNRYCTSFHGADIPVGIYLVELWEVIDFR